MFECLRCGEQFTWGDCPRCRGQGQPADHVTRLRAHALPVRIAMQPIRAALAGERNPTKRQELRVALRALEMHALERIEDYATRGARR